MALDFLPTPSWSVVYGEVPSASKWSELGENDDSLATGAGVDSLAIINRHVGLGSILPNNLLAGASSLNTHAWDNYTPTLTDIGLGNGVMVAKYIQIGKTIHVAGSITLGSTSSVSTSVGISLPVPASTLYKNNTYVGQVSFVDANGSNFLGVIEFFDLSPIIAFMSPLVASGTYLYAGSVNSAAPFTWVSGDKFLFSFTYEAA